MKTASASEHVIKEPKGLSDRISWLRDYYFPDFDGFKRGAMRKYL